jgi:hypothetical protein
MDRSSFWPRFASIVQVAVAIRLLVGYGRAMCMLAVLCRFPIEAKIPAVVFGHTSPAIALSCEIQSEGLSSASLTINSLIGRL